MSTERNLFQSICFHNIVPFTPPSLLFFDAPQKTRILITPTTKFPMASTLEKISVSEIQAYHSRERRLYSRMVLDLNMDPIRSMETIALWLWLDEQKNVIIHINSVDDANLQAIALTGQSFIDVLRIDTPPDQLAMGFHQISVTNINYYLKRVCLIAFNDIRRKAEAAARLHQMEILVRQMGNTSLDSINRNQNQMIPCYPQSFGSQPYVPHGEGSSRGVSPSLQSLTVSDVERRILAGYPFDINVSGQRLSTPQVGNNMPIMVQNVNNGMGLRGNYPVHGGGINVSGQRPSTPQFPQIGNGMPIMVQNVNNGMGLRRNYPVNGGGINVSGQRPSTPQFPQIGNGKPIMVQNVNNGMGHRENYPVNGEVQRSLRDNIPMEERMLFVTFSNGYPLTREELYNFFMRYYGDVELVNVHKPKDGKRPQYAYVSFYTLATVLRVLNGNEKVKFVLNGKHLWARRFVPKRNILSEAVNKGVQILG